MAEPGKDEIEVLTDVVNSKSEMVQKTLEPRVETDQAGFSRKVYKYGETTFSFRGREELPIIPTGSSSSSVELIGSAPIHTSKDEFEEYKKGMEKLSESRERLLIVTKDVQGVVALAIRLGAKDEGLKTMLDELGRGIYSGKALDLMDKLIAANCLEEGENGWIKELNGGDAEAVAILALLGNSDANSYLVSKLEQMGQIDRLREAKERSGERIGIYTNIDEKHRQLEAYKDKIDKEVCVHATSYKPIEGGGGIYEVRTTGDARGWEYVRNTVHVSLNHKVVSHMMGKWDLASYVLVSPMRDMVEENGSPRCIQEWDTWWVRNPGETLKFPKAFLVESGVTSKGKIFEIEDWHTFFKRGDYTIDDILEIEKSGSMIRPLDQFKRIFYDLGDNWDKEKLSQLFIEKYCDDEYALKKAAEEGYFYALQFVVSYTEKFDQKFKLSGGETVVARVAEVLQEIGIRKAFEGNEENFEAALRDITKSLVEGIERDIFGELSSLAVEETVRKMGYKPTGGGNWPSAHNDSVYAWFERGHYVDVEDASEVIEKKENGEKTYGNFDWRKFKPDYPTLAFIDSKTRRVLYASGAFNSREQ